MKTSMTAKVVVLLTVLSVGFSAWSKKHDDDDEDNFTTQKVIKIEVGDEDRAYSMKELIKKVNRLERAVRQLQDRVFDLEVENGQLKDDKGKKYTCYIKTNMKGTFTSTQKSLTQAKAEVMRKCSDEIKFGFECDEDKVKCGE